MSVFWFILGFLKNPDILQFAVSNLDSYYYSAKFKQNSNFFLDISLFLERIFSRGKKLL